MPDTDPRPRWYRLTPDRLIAAMLLAECLLWLSNWLAWPTWHKGYAVLCVAAAVGLFLFVMFVWFAVSLHFRNRFQFGIRSLLILTVVVAVPCSWLTAEMKQAREQMNIVNGLEIECDWQFDANGIHLSHPQPREPGLLRAVLGDGFFDEVVEVNPRNDAQMERLKELPRLQYLSLISAKISDAGLRHLEGWAGPQALWLDCNEITDVGLQYLEGMTRLESLSLGGTKITDAGLLHLEGMTRLESLSLGGTKITDAGLLHLEWLTRLESLSLNGTKISDDGLRHIERMSQLHDLDLSNTAITDAGLRHLEGLTKLKVLRLLHTHGTDEGVKKLQKALPHCTIYIT